ncbi:MAG TPA: OsmC family protein [Cyclobacteriaceae bacterium]
MVISATISNALETNEIMLETNGIANEIHIPAREGGGSSVNGGELLFLSLATCFCNDLYREARRRQIDIQSVTVKVSGTFGKEGEPASDIKYLVDIQSEQPREIILQLIKDVDKVAEVHNTLRQGVKVSLVRD